MATVTAVPETTAAGAPSTNPTERYRERWSWDAYLKDGKVVREEQAGVYSVVQDGVPDINPMGCQKGAGWTQRVAK